MPILPSSPIPYIVLALFLGAAVFALIILCALWAGGKSDERPEDMPWGIRITNNEVTPTEFGIYYRGWPYHTDWLAVDPPTWDW
jgi:hypothetical protein